MGNTETGQSSFSIEQFADDIAGLLDALDIRQAHILGWSMGALIAEEVALRHPGKVNKLADLGRGKPAVISYNAVPAVLFTCPQYGMVGKTEGTLQKEGITYQKSFGKHLQWPTYQRIGLAHAAYKILVSAEGSFLGAHFLADNAAGLVNAVRLAMENRITAAELYRQSILSPYPTRESDLIYMLKPLLA